MSRVLSLIFPTRIRPEWVGETCETIAKTITMPGQVEVVLGVDNADTTAHAAGAAAIKALSPHVMVRVLHGAWDDLGKKLIDMYADSVGDVRLFVADDFRFETLGWDRLLMDAAYRLPGGSVDEERAGAGVITVNDGMHNNVADYLRPNGVPGPFAITRAFADLCGYWMPSGFDFACLDTWCWDICRRADEMWMSKDKTLPPFRSVLWNCMIRHMHKSKPDENTSRADARLWEEVRKVYVPREGERQETAIAIVKHFRAKGV